jgi:hypothetical protein
MATVKRNPTQNQKTLTILLAFIPLGALIGLEFYVSHFDGWGAWAAAPLLLVPALLGITLGLIFLFDAIRAYRNQEAILLSVVLLLLALAPVFWLFIRRHLV